jgi:hypothetical protein
MSTTGTAGVENHASAVKPSRTPALFSVSLGLLRVIFDRSNRFGLLVDVRFAPKAT